MKYILSANEVLNSVYDTIVNKSSREVEFSEFARTVIGKETVEINDESEAGKCQRPINLDNIQRAREFQVKKTYYSYMVYDSCVIYSVNNKNWIISKSVWGEDTSNKYSGDIIVIETSFKEPLNISMNYAIEKIELSDYFIDSAVIALEDGSFTVRRDSMFAELAPLLSKAENYEISPAVYKDKKVVSSPTYAHSLANIIASSIEKIIKENSEESSLESSLASSRA